MKKLTASFHLGLWITALLLIGMLMGSLTSSEINHWYASLNRSPLTPPNFIFPIAWSFLYACLGGCGWLIWRAPPSPHLKLIKLLFAIQLVLNWSWTPLFFHFHLIGAALIVLVLMVVLTGVLILLTSVKKRTVALLLLPYMAWIGFAAYLNFFIWQHQ